ncbi:MAG: apolipoprotein N-acyltransferase [Candidatus Krumholzibacteria bacterium]|nr:apolipoprotein N-acyltransferase [Candidatus Krumholzibacteria bacterium]
MRIFSPVKWLPPLPLVSSAVASGVILALAFPRTSLSFLVFVAFLPVMVVLNRRPHPRSVFFKTGYLFGVAFFLGHLWWIVRLVPSSSITIPWLMAPALILLVLYLSVYPALVFWLLRVLGRGVGVTSIFVVPPLWALTEVFRSSGELGFAWGAVGYALAPYPSLIQLAAVVGLFGVGALVMLVNMLWSRVFLARGLRAKAGYLLLGGGLIAVLSLHGNRSIVKVSERSGGEPFTIAVAQPNVDLAIKWDPAYTDSTFRLIERLCRRAAPMEPKMIVFPETSAPVYIRYRPQYMNLLLGIAREMRMAVYIGFLDGRYDGPGDSLNVYNSCALFDVDGQFLQYDKTHLLPFGEAIPFASKYPRLKKLDFGQANFQPGPSRELAASSVGKIGPMICFESIFPDVARRLVGGGAEILVNITNDGWFGFTPGPYQHNEMAIFRAVENGRYLVRSANTGVSMVVDPVGRVVSALGLNEEGILIEDVELMSSQTIYTRLGNTPLIVAAILFVGVGTLAGRILTNGARES